jgi:glycosyltransferase 2 family protein
MAEPRVAGPASAADDEAGSPSVMGRSLTVITGIAGSRIVHWGFVVLALALAGYALARKWDPVRGALSSLGFWAVAGALVSVLLAYAVSVQVWRTLLASLGSPLRYTAAAKVLLVGQIGKYVPGSVWPVLASMELGRAHEVPRSRSASSSILQMLISLITGLLTALVTLPFAAGAMPYRWALLGAPVLLILLHPRVLSAVIGRVLRLVRQPPLGRPLTGRAVLRAMTWSFGGWICYGLQIWILAIRLGAPPGKTALVALGGFAFAWSIGFVAVFAPAGAGVRDVLLLVTLSPVLGTADGTAIVLVSRAATTVADLVGAAVATRSVRRPPSSVGDGGVGADLP